MYIQYSPKKGNIHSVHQNTTGNKQKIGLAPTPSHHNKPQTQTDDMQTPLVVIAALASLAVAKRPHRIGNFNFGLPGNATKSAKAPKQPGCPLPKSLTAEQIARNGIQCNTSVNGFHYLCGEYNYEEAAEACIEHGWRLAVVDDSNKLDVQSLIQQCSLDYEQPAWIASFNGLEGRECAVASAEGFATNGFPEEVCQSDLNVVCQELPVETVTDPVPVDTVTVSEAFTSTIAVIPTCPGIRIRPCPCKNPNTDFVFLDTLLPYAQAECACEQLGFKLADLTIQNFLDASKELWDHLGHNKHAWIHSWNGDVYTPSDCLALWTGSTGPNGAIAVPQSCDNRKPVLCQKRKYHCSCKPEQPGCLCNPHHGHHGHHHRVFLDKDDPKQKEKFDFEVEALKVGEDKCVSGHCPKVCKYRVGNIRVVKAETGAYEAAEVCRKFGWSLLDLNEWNQYKAAALQLKCGEEEDGYSMWIQSFDRVDGAACIVSSPLLPFLTQKSARLARNLSLPSVASFIFTADQCAELGDLYVLCEKCDEVETISGTFSGDFTTTTVTSGFTVSDIVYTTTVFTTVTLLQ